MDPELTAVAAAQHGIFFRRQVLACGYRDAEIARLVRTGRWKRLRRGCYCERALYDAAGARGRHLLVVRAALAAVEPPAVVTNESACAVHDLARLGTAIDRVHISRAGAHSGRDAAGVRHHEAPLTAAEQTTRDGIAVTTLERTALDMGRKNGFEAGVVVVDAALRAGADHESMRRLAAPMADWAGSRAMNRAIAFGDRGAHSPGESLTRIVAAEAGLPPTHTQYKVTDGAFLAFVDLVVEEFGLGIEFDGRMKYRRTREPSDPVVDDGDIVWAEKQREEMLRDLGLQVIVRVVWDELFGARRVLLRRRLAESGERAARRRRPVYVG